MRATLINAAKSIAKTSLSATRVSKVTAAKTTATRTAQKSVTHEAASPPAEKAATKRKSTRRPVSANSPANAATKTTAPRTATAPSKYKSPKVRRAQAEREALKPIHPLQLSAESASTYLTTVCAGLHHRKIIPFNDVISPSLCDDVLSYLGPTLEKYRGCTLVDLNPGCAIWSAKLHAHLQPKRHFLIEDNPDLIELIIKPLLDEPNSTYVHINQPLDPISFERVISEELLGTDELAPPDQPWVRGDPRERQINYNVLVIGNLSRYYARVGSIPDQKAKVGRLITHAFTKASAWNGSLHRHGLVRGLFWVREEEKPFILCLSDQSKRPRTARLNMDARITEVVACTPLYAVPRGDVVRSIRLPEMEVIRSAEIQERSQRLGMTLPAHRKVSLANPARPPPNGVEIPSPFQSLLLGEAQMEAYLSDLEATADFWTALPDSGRSLTNHQRLKKVKEWQESIEFDWVVHIPALWSSGRKRAIGPGRRTQADLNTFLSTLRLEASVVAYEARTGETLTSLRSRIKVFVDAQNAAMAERATNYASVTAGVLDELQSAFTNPPVLPRDRRSYEAMQAESKEFWPPTLPLSLLDVVPDARDMAVPGIASRSEGASAAFEICKIIFNVPNHSVVAALNQLAPNAGPDLTALVPELQDPRLGGRLHPEHMRVRMLSNEMIEKLAKAFWEWPFRPDLWQLEARSLEYQRNLVGPDM